MPQPLVDFRLCKRLGPPLHQQRKKIECLWRKVDRLRAAEELPRTLVQRKWSKSDGHESFPGAT